MASLSTVLSGKDTVDILDPGAGIGILSCAILQRIIDEFPNIKNVRIVAYELDIIAVKNLYKVFEELQVLCSEKGVLFNYTICNKDFVNEFYDSKDIGEEHKFDLVISNPPYFKLSHADKQEYLFNDMLKDYPNIYAVFISISINLIRKDGEIIFITPRSFTSGKYFSKFRDYLIRKIFLSFIHSFESRSKAFRTENVLQEIIIFRGKLRKKEDSYITLSNSCGIDDIYSSKQFGCAESNILGVHEIDNCIFIPHSQDDLKLLDDFKKLSLNLFNLNLKASTGPIVFFRNLDLLNKNNVKETIPLFWLNNVFSLELTWPNNLFDKPQFISSNGLNTKNVLKKDNYVLIRRFSAKGDKKRLIACPVFRDDESLKPYDYIGVENKLNYIYKIDDTLTKCEAMGLSAILSSTIYNSYFKMLNGNTNVSVSELNQIPLPSMKTISNIGKKAMNTGVDFEMIDNEVNKIIY
jgi:adenine-specific DNA-methyltransferase